MQDKDVFQKLYSKLLAKRLINQTSASNDCEKRMIITIQVPFHFPIIDFLCFFRMHVALNIHQSYNECFKILKRVRILLINIERIVKKENLKILVKIK